MFKPPPLIKFDLLAAKNAANNSKIRKFLTFFLNPNGIIISAGFTVNSDAVHLTTSLCILFKPPDYGKRRKILPAKRFDYIVPLEEDLTDGFSAIEHLQPHISEAYVLSQDESFSMFTVHMDFIIIPGADFVIVPTPPVSKADLQAWIEPARFTHLLNGFSGNCKILNPFHERPPLRIKKPSLNIREGLWILFSVVIELFHHLLSKSDSAPFPFRT
jgi:hypothetical protein